MNALILFMAAGIVLAVIYSYQAKQYQKRRAAARDRALELLGIDKWNQAMNDRGFIFCNLFSIQNIEECGKQMGIELFKVDCLRIAAAIKSSFEPEKGINNNVIREAIVVYRMKYENSVKSNKEYTF